MDKDNFIKVPTEYGNLLARMGLPEYSLIQEDTDGVVITAPMEFCRNLVRMGGSFKDCTDLTFIFRKATQCADQTIAADVLVNQACIKKVSQTENDCTVEVDINQLKSITSTVNNQTKKWICMLIRTNFDTIEGATWNGSKITAADVQDSIDMGGTKQDICWWIDAESIVGHKVDKTVAKEGYSSEKVSIIGVDVSTYNLSYTNEGDTVTATFTDKEGAVITPGTGCIAKGTEVHMSLISAEGKLIDTVKVNNQQVTVDNATFTSIVTESASENIVIIVTAKDEPVQPDEPVE